MAFTTRPTIQNKGSTHTSTGNLVWSILSTFSPAHTDKPSTTRYLAANPVYSRMSLAPFPVPDPCFPGCLLCDGVTFVIRCHFNHIGILTHVTMTIEGDLGLDLQFSGVDITFDHSLSPQGQVFFDH